MTDQEVWKMIDDEDLWIFDKLIIAKRSGHECGSRGFKIQKTGLYCIRPVTNFEGHGHSARIEHRQENDWMMDIHPGEFWVEKFNGTHISVDYVNGKQKLTVAGYRNELNPLYKFDFWQKIKFDLPLPKMLAKIAKKYPVVNCEFIGKKLIEVHLRENPDFAWGNSEMIPVWTKEQLKNIPENYTYISDLGEEEKRIGILVK